METERPVVRLVTDREAARLLGVSRTAVWGLLHRGELGPPVRIGRARRIPLDAIDAFIQRQAEVRS